VVPWAVIIVVFFPDTADDLVRYWGLVLEILGIVTVGYGLWGRQRLFNRPGYFGDLLDWLGQCPRWGIKPVNAVVEAGLLSLSASLKGLVWEGVSPEASIETRLAALQVNFEILRTEQAEIAKKLQEETTKWMEALNSEHQMRELAIIDIRKQLEALGAGTLHIEWVGIFWLILGVVFTTIPTEIAGVLKWLWRIG